MKKISILGVVFASMALFSACDNDIESNPILKQPKSFVLNTPALSDNVIDLDNSQSVVLTCSQPDYGYTAAVTYSVEVSLNESFENFETLSTKYTTAKMAVSASEMAVSITNQLVDAGKTEADFPLTASVYVRLKGELSEGQGTVRSNSIDLNTNLSFSLPPIELPENLYMIGQFCEWSWDKAAEMVPVNSAPGVFWSLQYMPENGGIKFNRATSWDGNDVGYDKVTVNDNYNAGVSRSDDGNIVVGKAGWYLFVATVVVDGNDFKYSLDINEPAVYLFGPAIGDLWEASDNNKFSVPESADDYFVSPAFTASVPSSSDSGVRACVVIPGYDWWKSEFMVFDGVLEYRGNGGDQARVGGNAGQKLYINFTNGTGKIE